MGADISCCLKLSYFAPKRDQVVTLGAGGSQVYDGDDKLFLPKRNLKTTRSTFISVERHSSSEELLKSF